MRILGEPLPKPPRGPVSRSLRLPMPLFVPRLPARPLLAALAVHALAALLLWPLVGRVPERREYVPVSLHGPEASEAASGVRPERPVGR